MKEISRGDGRKQHRGRGGLQMRSDAEIAGVRSLLDQVREKLGEFPPEEVSQGPILIPQHLRGHKNYRHKPYET